MPNARNLCSQQLPSERSVSFAPSEPSTCRSMGSFIDPVAMTRSSTWPFGVDYAKVTEGRSPEDEGARPNWNVKDEALVHVQNHFPLEQTRIVIEKEDGLASDIAARVSDVLRSLSCAASYDDDNATAYLCTQDHVQMVVRLYKHHNAGTIVEIQRTSGNSISFYRHGRCIFDAARGKEVDAEAIFKVNRVGELSINEEVVSVQEERRHITSALQMVYALISKDRMDANRLGLESLLLMTQPEMTSRFTALMTSWFLLCKNLSPRGGHRMRAYLSAKKLEFDMEEPQLGNLGITDVVISLILHRDFGPKESERSFVGGGNFNVSNDLFADCIWSSGRDDASFRGFRSFDEEHAELMHNCALAILANALDVLHEAGSLGEIIRGHQWLEGKELISKLIDELKKARTRPHDAYFSARCLGSLTRDSKEARKLARHLEAPSVANRAHGIGRCTHAKLEMATDVLCQALSAAADL